MRRHQKQLWECLFFFTRHLVGQCRTLTSRALGCLTKIYLTLSQLCPNFLGATGEVRPGINYLDQVAHQWLAWPYQSPLKVVSWQELRTKMLNSLAVVHHQKLFFKISSPRICLRNSKTLKQALRLNATDRHVRHWAPSEQHQHDYSSRSNKKNTKVSPKG